MHAKQWRMVWAMLLPVVLGLGAWAALADPDQGGRLVGGFQLHVSPTRKSVSEEQVIAGQPSLAVGSLTGDLANPVPFVAFTQRRFGTSFQDVLVRFFDKGSSQWRTVAQNRNDGSLNRDRTVIAGQPSLEFGGPLVNGLPSVPWVAWQEPVRTLDNKTDIFAAFLGQDANGALWQITGEQGGNRGVPGLNASTSENAANQDQDARNPKIASGMLAGETQPQPWVVFEQTENNGAFTQIIVKQWTGTTWRPVGPPVNVNRFARAYDPDIFFIGNVPHVAWAEDLGGFRLLYVKHLGDVRPGRERWDLDADISRGLNVVGFNPAVGPSLHGTRSTPYVAWEERNRFGNETLVFEARRVPEGEAWGSNRPPFIRVISGTGAVDLAKQLPLSDAAQAQLAAPDQAGTVIGSATITTSCDHVNGWDNITAIEFKLANEGETALLARFDGETGRISVLDPVYNTVIGSGLPGVDGPIETPNVTVHLEQMSVTSHGEDSPAVDITWVLDFKRPVQFKEFTQLLNIKTRAAVTPKGDQGATETGFFEVGRLTVSQYQLTLPGVVRGDHWR
ncbi:MAG: hypothetical protein KIT87_25725 [Anaerolineae bacterium]|nr:hypothetical protein [Anaerolineae bacterium]